MKEIKVLVAAMVLAIPLGANAQDAKSGEAAAKKLGCLKCHAVASDKDGPSFKKSAEKYKGDAAKLEAKLQGDRQPTVVSGQ